MAIEESLGLSQVAPAEVEERPLDRGSSTPLSKQSVKRLLKSLLRTENSMLRPHGSMFAQFAKPMRSLVQNPPFFFCFWSPSPHRRRLVTPPRGEEIHPPTSDTCSLEELQRTRLPRGHRKAQADSRRFVPSVPRPGLLSASWACSNGLRGARTTLALPLGEGKTSGEGRRFLAKGMRCFVAKAGGWRSSFVR